MGQRPLLMPLLLGLLVALTLIGPVIGGYIYNPDMGDGRCGGSGVGHCVGELIKPNKLRIGARAEFPYGQFWANGRMWAYA